MQRGSAGIAIPIAMLVGATVLPEPAGARLTYQEAYNRYNGCKAVKRHGFVNSFLNGNWERYNKSYAKEMESVNGPWHRNCVYIMHKEGYWK